jgi:Flp pilus assembly protein TadD
VPAQPVAEVTIEEPAVVESTASMPLRPVARLATAAVIGGDKDEQVVQQARDLLAHGGLNAAMTAYIKLIKRGKLLEEVIYDLQEAVYSHPVDVIVWQTLGDAYFSSNRLQEALDAYSKAEELLR